jgi:hypothetical protein
MLGECLRSPADTNLAALGDPARRTARGFAAQLTSRLAGALAVGVEELTLEQPLA